MFVCTNIEIFLVNWWIIIVGIIITIKDEERANIW